jgi:ABC-type ATPase involved in cell division/GNAT superfamily N-acetyltransferase
VRVSVARSVPVVRSPRVLQLSGLFDLPPTERSEAAWDVELPIETDPWSIGLIVGPSGSGKTTVAREAFGNALVAGYDWQADRSVVDGFPDALGIKDVTALLSSVGFSSPPSWLRPFRCLSNGEQFRATLARALADPRPVIAVDEFTSVVDRTVAQIGSAAVAKAVRRLGRRFVAVTCHYDVEEWLTPDWVLEMPAGQFTRRPLRRRTPVELEVARVDSSAWRLFKHHHYLTAALNPSAVCFCAFWRGRPVAFDAWLPFVGRLKGRQKARRGHRTVCLPDFQGVGIGNALFTFCAALWKGLGYRVFSCTGHPAEVGRRRRSPDWRMTRAPSFTARDGSKDHSETFRRYAARRASSRLTASFEYVGPALDRSEAVRVSGCSPACPS